MWILSFAKNMSKSIDKNTSKNLSKKGSQNVLVKINNLLQMHLKLFQEEQLKRQ